MKTEVEFHWSYNKTFLTCHRDLYMEEQSRTDMSFDCLFKLFLGCKVSSVFKICQGKEERSKHFFCVINIGSLPPFDPGLWFFFSTVLQKTLDALTCLYSIILVFPWWEFFVCILNPSIKIQVDMGVLQLISVKNTFKQGQAKLEVMVLINIFCTPHTPKHTFVN